MERKQLIYWKKKEEILCDQLRTALIVGNSYETSRILRKIEGKLRWMIESIMIRYFGGQYNYNDTDTFVNDTLTHIVTKLHHFKKEKKKTYFSYISTIAKRQLYTQIVRGYVFGYNSFRRNDSRIDFEKNEEIIENIDNLFHLDESEKEQEEKSKEILFQYLDNLYMKYHQLEKDSIKQGDITNYGQMKNAVKCLKKTIIFFSGNRDVSKSEMVDYLIENYNVTTYYLNKAFNCESFVKRQTKNDEDKVHNYLNYQIDFDFAPDVSYSLANYRQQKIKKYHGDLYTNNPKKSYLFNINDKNTPKNKKK